MTIEIIDDERVTTLHELSLSNPTLTPRHGRDVLNISDFIPRYANFDLEVLNRTIDEYEVYEDLPPDDPDSLNRQEVDALQQMRSLRDDVEHVSMDTTFIYEDNLAEETRRSAQDSAENSLAGGYSLHDFPFNYIDWEAAAEELEASYTSFDFNGYTYYYID